MKRGFTLIELLVVIAIIGILSSIVLASLNTARLKSRDARRIADLKQLQLAMQLFYDANSSYPTTTLAALAPTYIQTIPKDPVGNVSYYFDSLNSGASYHLGADLEDANNQALQSDSDTTSTSFTATNDSTGCLATVTNRYCYDLKP